MSDLITLLNICDRCRVTNAIKNPNANITVKLEFQTHENCDSCILGIVQFMDELSFAGSINICGTHNLSIDTLRQLTFRKSNFHIEINARCIHHVYMVTENEDYLTVELYRSIKYCLRSDFHQISLKELFQRIIELGSVHAYSMQRYMSKLTLATKCSIGGIIIRVDDYTRCSKLIKEQSTKRDEYCTQLKVELKQLQDNGVISDLQNIIYDYMVT